MKTHTTRITLGVIFSIITTASAQSVVRFTNGQLFVDTPNGDQNIKFVVGANPGQTQVFGIPGIADGTSYTSVRSINLITGDGFDKIEFDVISAPGLAITSNTVTGQAETKIQWKVAPSTLRSINSLALRSISGQTKTELSFISEAQNTDFIWTMNHAAGNSEINGGINFKAPGRRALGNVAFNLGDGQNKVNLAVDSEVLNTNLNLDTGKANEAVVKVMSDNPTDFLGLNFNGRSPITSLEVASAAKICNLDVTGVHMGISNELKYAFNQIRPGTVSAFYDIQTGSGMDKIEGNISAPGSTVVVDGLIVTNAGDDMVDFKSSAASTVVGLDLTSGDGNDFLSIALDGFYQNSQTIGPVITAGNGDDTLIVTTNTAIRGTGLPNDVEATIDGGAGFDRFNAFGFILNCEQRL